jgi:hypothetical protein
MAGHSARANRATTTIAAVAACVLAAQVGSTAAASDYGTYKKGDPVRVFATHVGPVANPSETYPFYVLREYSDLPRYVTSPPATAVFTDSHRALAVQPIAWQGTMRRPVKILVNPCLVMSRCVVVCIVSCPATSPDYAPRCRRSRLMSSSLERMLTMRL